MEIAIFIVRILLGLLFVVFGLNGWFHFIPLPPRQGRAAEFIGAMVGTGYFNVVLLLLWIEKGLALRWSSWFFGFSCCGSIGRASLVSCRIRANHPSALRSASDAEGLGEHTRGDQRSQPQDGAFEEAGRSCYPADMKRRTASARIGARDTAFTCGQSADTGIESVTMICRIAG
jgi:hypothetical protein